MLSSVESGVTAVLVSTSISGMMDSTATNVVVGAIVVVLGYLVGSIPAANLLARRQGVSDLRTVGDRNPGYWNARQTLGGRRARGVFVADVAKGAAAGVIGLIGVALTTDTLETAWLIGYAAVGAAMVGHAFPVFDRFHGGRSVLTFVGGVVVLAPVAAAVAIAVLGAVFAITRRFDLAARVGVAAFPIVQLVVEGPYRTAATGVLMTFIGIRFAQAAVSDRSRTADRASSGGS